MIYLICPLMEIISSGKSTKFLLKQQHKHPSPPSSITNINRRFQESKRKFPTYGIFPHFACFFLVPYLGVLHVRRYMYIKYTVPEEKIKEKILTLFRQSQSSASYSWRMHVWSSWAPWSNFSDCSGQWPNMGAIMFTLWGYFSLSSPLSFVVPGWMMKSEMPLHDLS